MLLSIEELVDKLEQIGESGVMVGREEGESLACQVLLLTLLMEV